MNANAVWPICVWNVFPITRCESVRVAQFMRFRWMRIGILKQANLNIKQLLPIGCWRALNQTLTYRNGIQGVSACRFLSFCSVLCRLMSPETRGAFFSSVCLQVLFSETISVVHLPDICKVYAIFKVQSVPLGQRHKSWTIWLMLMQCWCSVVEWAAVGTRIVR